MASYLLSLGADPEARTAYKMTPLHVASFYGSAKVIDLLLKEVKGLQIDALDFGSCECLALALAPAPRDPRLGDGRGR